MGTSEAIGTIGLDRGLDHAGGPDPARAAREVLKCLASTNYFCDHYVQIDDAQGHGGQTGIAPFRLWASQRALADVLAKYKLVQILKARQLGISWLVCADKLRKCLAVPNRVVLLISKGLREANELLRRMRAMYARLPAWLKAELPGINPSQDNKSELGFTNGSVIYSMPASGNAGISFTASDVVMDEAAHQRWGGSLFANIKPTIDDGGDDAQMVVLSTANGVGDFFHTLWTKSTAGDTGFKPVFLPWWARPGRDREWYDRILAQSEEPALVPQNYPANPVEAFLSSGSSRFANDWIAAQYPNVEPEGIPAARWSPMMWRPTRWDPTQSSIRLPNLSDVPGLRVYRPPTQEGRYCIAADVAEGLEEGDYDYDAAAVIDIDTGEEMADLYGRWETDEYARYLMALSEPYNAWVVVERNNHGHAVLATMKLAGFPRIADGPDKAPGWLTTSRTKPEGVSIVAEHLRDRTVTIRSAATLAEMQVFSRHRGGRLAAPEGFHDDRVMAWVVGLSWIRQFLTSGAGKDVCAAPYPLAAYRGRRMHARQDAMM